MELKLIPYTVPQSITWNYEELKAELTAKASEYASIVYTDDQIKAAKADRANLNRLKKALNDERIRQEREYMQPFNNFKAQINEVIGIIDKPIEAIDRQVKAFENKQKDEKRKAITDYWEETGAPEWMRTYQTAWLNASRSLKDVQAEIDSLIAQSEKDLAVIHDLPAYAFDAEKNYKQTRSLTEALSEAKRLEKLEEQKAAYEAKQEKRKSEAAIAQGSRTAEPAHEPEPAHELPVEQPREWVSFKALLTTDDAKALKIFCQQRGIRIEALAL